MKQAYQEAVLAAQYLWKEIQEGGEGYSLWEVDYDDEYLFMLRARITSTPKYIRRVGEFGVEISAAIRRYDYLFSDADIKHYMQPGTVKRNRFERAIEKVMVKAWPIALTRHRLYPVLQELRYDSDKLAALMGDEFYGLIALKEDELGTTVYDDMDLAIANRWKEFISEEIRRQLKT